MIFQIGSSDPILAIEAARTVQQDVSGMCVILSVLELTAAISIVAVPNLSRE